MELRTGAKGKARAGVWAQKTVKEEVEVLLLLVEVSGRLLTSSFLLPKEKLWQGLQWVWSLAIA